MAANTPSTQVPSSILLMTELGRGLLELGSYAISIPFLQFVPKGDGHPVLVLPGMLTTDHTTIPLRFFLNTRNYSAYPWDLGLNMLAFKKIEQKMLELIEQLYKKYKRKISLIGWSAGGIFARAMAHKVPHYIRQVITLASPFNGILRKSNVEAIGEWLSGQKAEEIEQLIIEQASAPPPVPSTSIYSKMDGIVSWQACQETQESQINENVEVSASHLGMGHNPQVLICIADRLAQKEEDWKPFRHSSVGKLFYTFPWQT